MTNTRGVTILRIVVGAVFIAHGAQKLFVYGLAGTGKGMAGMGIPLPEVAAVVVALVEFLGGIALVLGIGTRIAASLIAIQMLVAVLKVHLKNGFFMPNGFEYALTLMAANVALVLTGPGALALDNLLGRNKPVANRKDVAGVRSVEAA